MEGLANYNPGLGYGFYEFTMPEFISYDKQVILMDKVPSECIKTIQSQCTNRVEPLYKATPEMGTSPGHYAWSQLHREVYKLLLK